MNEEELASDIRTLESYKAQLDGFDQQFEFLAMTIKEHTRAKETMEGYKDLKEGRETLIPIGAGSYLFAKVATSDKAVVGIGADIVVETEIEDAIKKLEERIVEVEAAAKGLTEKYKEVTHLATELSAKIQSTYQQGR